MLKGKIALITGSTSGIGLATAHVLAAQGINLVLHGLMSTSEGEQLANEFSGKYGINTLFDNADLRNVDSIDAFMLRTIEQMGSIDILINNAGIQHTEIAENFPLDKWNAIIAINLSAAFHAIQQSLPSMKSKGWGRIINVSSVVAQTGFIGTSAYAASKSGLYGFTKSVAREVANKNITVNTMSYGYMNTGMIDSLTEELKEQILAQIPKKKFGPIESIAKTITYLASEEASYITGQNIPINGGLA